MFFFASGYCFQNIFVLTHYSIRWHKQSTVTAGSPLLGCCFFISATYGRSDVKILEELSTRTIKYSTSLICFFSK